MMKTAIHSLAAVMLLASSGAAATREPQQIQLDVQPGYSIVQSGEKKTAWIRVGLTGFEIRADRKRAPANIALVLDKSGSMQGQKIEQARAAAIDAIGRLRPDDIVSVITYDSTVEVLVPATKLTDKSLVTQAISRIQAGGNTALFAGVSKGAAEIRKFMDLERVNRVILLSDGKANNGPSSPAELGQLGASLMKEHIAVSTLGLGLDYNEDLMVQLAGNSGGNHVFIEDATELADIFNREFDDVMSVVAQDVEISINVPDGIRPIRVLGNAADINGQTVVASMNQIYSRQNKHLVIEVELPPSAAGHQLRVANVTVSYQNMESNGSDRLTATASISFSASPEEVQASLNKIVMEDVVALVASEQNKLATDFLDKGDLVNCRATLTRNREFLKENADKLKSPKLYLYLDFNESQQTQVESNDTNRARKSMRAYQNAVDSQQVIAPSAGVAQP